MVVCGVWLVDTVDGLDDAGVELVVSFQLLLRHVVGELSLQAVEEDVELIFFEGKGGGHGLVVS